MSKKKDKKSGKLALKKGDKTSSGFSLKKYLPLAIIVGLLGFVLYANTIQHEWALDDFSVIKENFVTQQGFAGIGTHLTHSYRYGYGAGFGTLYRPLTPVMFEMEWQMFPDNPNFMHFVNVLFYALTGVLLFFTLSRIFKSYNLILPFTAAVVFMIHPLHTESVANIKGRDDIMGFFFFLLAVYWLWDYLSKSNVKWLALSLGSFFLAIMAKESSVTYVAVFPLLIHFFTKTSLEKNLKLSGGYLAVSLVFIAMLSTILGKTIGTDNTSILDNVLVSADNFVQQKATAFLILGRYLKLLFFPHPLVSDAGYSQIPLTSFGDWKVLLSFVIHVGLAVWAMLNIKRKSVFSFGILFYILTLSITSNLVFNIGTSYAERLLYVPVLGFSIVVAYSLMKIFKLEERRSKGFGMGSFFKKNIGVLGFLGVVVFLFSFKTIDRNAAWKDSYTLYDTDIKISPECGKLLYHYSLELSKKGLTLAGDDQSEMMNKAKTVLEKAIEVYPKYSDAHARLGWWFNKAGFNDKAEEHYNLAIQYNQSNAKAYNNLGVIYFEKSAAERAKGNLVGAKAELQKAKGVYEKAVEKNPRYVDGWQNLGVIYAMQKQFPDAIKYFEKAKEFAIDVKQVETLNNYLDSARQGK
jgi:tetratricopeptide (TPR) repeat protein